MLYVFTVMFCLHAAPCKKPVWVRKMDPTVQYVCDMRLGRLPRLFSQKELRHVKASCEVNWDGWDRA